MCIITRVVVSTSHHFSPARPRLLARLLLVLGLLLLMPPFLRRRRPPLPLEPFARTPLRLELLPQARDLRLWSRVNVCILLCVVVCVLS